MSAELAARRTAAAAVLADFKRMARADAEAALVSRRAHLHPVRDGKGGASPEAAR